MHWKSQITFIIRNRKTLSHKLIIHTTKHYLFENHVFQLFPRDPNLGLICQPGLFEHRTGLQNQSCNLKMFWTVWQLWHYKHTKEEEFCSNAFFKSSWKMTFSGKSFSKNFLPFWESCFSTFSTWSQPTADLSSLSFCTPNLPPNPEE